MGLENKSIEDIMLGDGNVFAVIGRSVIAMKRSGCTQDFIDEFLSKVYASHEYDEALATCAEYLETAGFRFGEKEMTDDETLIQAIYSGENDSLTIEQLKEKFNIK